MRVLGIDPSSRRLGWAVIEGQRVYSMGTIEPKGKDLGEKLRQIRQGLVGVFDQCYPEAVGVEEPFIGRNAKTGMVLASVFGVVLEVCAEFDRAAETYAPATVKAAVGVGGNADKAQVSRMVMAMFGLDEDPGHDVTDALAVAWRRASCQ